MRQAWIVGLAAVVGAACGGTSTGGDALVSAPPTVAPEVPPVTAKALGIKLGLAYTANVMGELEPCG